jgi:prepilin-type N-terminal cleavage/methylation domain-containing protein
MIKTKIKAGFTLIEMLIVMGIMVLAITLAIPAIRILTGSRSEQAAQNTVSAFLARVRAEAIGLQRAEGVLFYIDLATDRVNLCQVFVTSARGGDVPGVAYLDLVPDRDNLVLPRGILAWTMKDQADTSTGAVDPFPAYRYLGYNLYPNQNWTGFDRALFGGVILFDGHGQTTPVRYGFRFTDSSTGSVTLLGKFGYSTPGTNANWPDAVPNLYIRSQIGFVLVDREALHIVQGLTATPDGNPNTAEAVIDPWIEANTTPILVNRYNGTLIRAE